MSDDFYVEAVSDGPQPAPNAPNTVVLTFVEWKRLNDRITELSCELDHMREGIKLLGSIDRVLKFLDRQRIVSSLDSELAAALDVPHSTGEGI